MIYMKKTTLLLVVIMLISCFTGSYVEAAEQYVTVSFEDYSLRANENCDFPKPLGKIIGKTKVKIQDRDTIATVTLRLLSQLNIDAYYSGNAEMGGGFYLESIDNFTAENGKKVSDGYGLGEFSAGENSGWTISYNGILIDKAASEYYIKNGDSLIWKYTALAFTDVVENNSSVTAPTQGTVISKNNALSSSRIRTNNRKNRTYATSKAINSKIQSTSSSRSNINNIEAESKAENNRTVESTTVIRDRENITETSAMGENKIEKTTGTKESGNNSNKILYIIFIIAVLTILGIIVCIIILYRDRKNKEE